MYKEYDLLTKTLLEEGTELEELGKKMDRRYAGVKEKVKEKGKKIEFTQTHINTVVTNNKPFYVIMSVIFYGK